MAFAAQPGGCGKPKQWEFLSYRLTRPLEMQPSLRHKADLAVVMADGVRA